MSAGGMRAPVKKNDPEIAETVLIPYRFPLAGRLSETRNRDSRKMPAPQSVCCPDPICNHFSGMVIWRRYCSTVVFYFTSIIYLGSYTASAV
jgi:hypothetical protein